MSLHLSFGEMPEYLGTHATVEPNLLVFRFNPLNASHCSSRKLFPGAVKTTTTTSHEIDAGDLCSSVGERLENISKWPDTQGATTPDTTLNILTFNRA